MLAMAERFVDQAWAHAGIPFDRDTCEALLHGMIARDDAILLVSPDVNAMIGALVYPWHFNAAIKTAQELFWWSEKGCPYGTALLDEAEIRAAAMGAASINMAMMDHMRPAAISAFYVRRGYRPNEHIFIKELKPWSA